MHGGSIKAFNYIGPNLNQARGQIQTAKARSFLSIGNISFEVVLYRGIISCQTYLQDVFLSIHNFLRLKAEEESTFAREHLTFFFFFLTFCPGTQLNKFFLYMQHFPHRSRIFMYKTPRLLSKYTLTKLFKRLIREEEATLKKRYSSHACKYMFVKSWGGRFNVQYID